MVQLIAILIAAVMFVIIAVNMIMGVTRGLKKTLASLVAVIISAIIAAVATVLLCMPSWPVVSWLTGLIVDAVASAAPEAAGLMQEAFVTETLSSYIAMIAAPFVFTILFIIISIIATIVAAIIIKKIPILKNCPKVAHRLGGLGVGLVCGLVVAVLCVFSVVGVVDIANVCLCTVYDDLIVIEEVQDAVEQIPVDIEVSEDTMRPFDYVGCGLLYNAFSTTYYGDGVVNLKSEVVVLMDIADAALVMSEKEVEAVSPETVEVLEKVVEGIDKSPVLKNVIVEGINYAVENDYINDSTFDFGELVNPIVNAVVDVVATTDKDTLVGDLTTFVNVFSILVESEIMDDTDAQAILNKIGDGLASDLLVEINKNERMYPVADEITNLSIRALADTLGIPESADERYDDLMNKIAFALNETEGQDDDSRLDNLSQKLNNIFADYGVEVKGEALDHVTEGLIADLGDGATGEAVKEFFMIYHAANVGANPEAQAGGDVNYLSSESASGIVVNSNGTVTVNGVELHYYKASTYKNSKAYTYGATNVAIGAADTFYSASTINSTVMTADDILAGLGHYGDCSDAIAESEKVGEIFKSITGVIAGKDLDNIDGVEIFNEIGPVFDQMKNSQIFNGNTAKNMLTAIFQSEKIADVLGLSLKDMTDFANKINDYAMGHEHGYEDATKAISGTISAVSKATSKDATDEEKIAAAVSMLSNINKGNAEMITSMLTDSMLDKFGSNTENTQNAVDAVKNLVNNMADYKEGAPDDESVAKEAEAVTKLINVATTGTSNGPLFDTADGEKGALASDPDSLIDTIVGSEVVMQTITDSVGDQESGSNPYGISYSSEEEKDSVAEALENYYAENDGDEELAEKLANLAVLMDVEVSFGK